MNQYPVVYVCYFLLIGFGDRLSCTVIEVWQEEGGGQSTPARLYRDFTQDSEETANCFEVWPEIAWLLGIKRGTAEYKAVANMWALLEALYGTYQGPQRP